MSSTDEKEARECATNKIEIFSRKIELPISYWVIVVFNGSDGAMFKDRLPITSWFSKRIWFLLKTFPSWFLNFFGRLMKWKVRNIWFFSGWELCVSWVFNFHSSIKKLWNMTWKIHNFKSFQTVTFKKFTHHFQCHPVKTRNFNEWRRKITSFLFSLLPQFYFLGFFFIFTIIYALVISHFRLDIFSSSDFRLARR